MESSYKPHSFSRLDNMNTIHLYWLYWQGMSLLVNRGAGALKFRVIEFVEVIVLPKK